MSSKLLFHMHIMWYESHMINETLDSLYNAMQYSPLPIDIKICLNSQTYLESPIEGIPSDMFDEFIDHPIISISTVIHKTDDDDFYNIGDWRRELYHEYNYKYIIWGESDCLIPIDYFHILSYLDIQYPHILTLSSRKMWDKSWTSVEATTLQSLECVNNQIPSHPEYYPYRYYDYINQYKLDEFNSSNNVILIPINPIKLDGAMVALSSQLPTPFLHINHHFCHEDTCAQLFFQYHNIPQFNISNRMKGHNYHHPLKRINTLNTRNDELYQLYKHESLNVANLFIKQLYENNLSHI